MRSIVAIIMFTGLLVAQTRNAAEEIARAERAFSAASDTVGIKESFLRFLSDDCVMFNPHPVNGKSLYRDRPASTNHLTWKPAVVEASASGNFGISTGPWEIRPHGSETVAAIGYYYSVWEKSSDGEWRVIADVGVPYPKEQFVPEAERFSRMKTVPRSSGASSSRNEMEKTEEEFIASIGKRSLSSVINRFAAHSLRVYRMGFRPGTKREESMDLLTAVPLRSTYSPLSFRKSSAGDMGFVYGYAVSSAGDSAAYFRVWKKEGEWKLSADIEIPFRR